MPCEGCFTIEYVNLLASLSDAVSVIDLSVFGVVATFWLLATGLWFVVVPVESVLITSISFMLTQSFTLLPVKVICTYLPFVSGISYFSVEVVVPLL